MSTISIFNSSSNSISLHTDSAVVTQSGDADWTQSQLRHLANAVAVFPPGASQQDLNFWNAWTAANPTSTLLTNHILFPA
jgi:hypothetical protein